MGPIRMSLIIHGKFTLFSHGAVLVNRGGLPRIMSGLANTIEEAEQINRLCRIVQWSQL